MAKILLLGATGLLGASFRDYFLSSSIDLAFYPSRNELNVLKYNELKNYIKNITPDYVINCTGYNAVDNAEKDEEKNSCYELNVEVPSNLAKLSVDLDFKLVQFSSDYVFNGKSDIGYTENDIPDPISFYGETKLLAENAIKSNCENYIIQRISWLFGPGKTNFVDFVAKKLLGGENVSVVIDQIGNPTYSVDVVKTTAQLLSIGQSGLFHTVNSDSVSWFELAVEVAEALNLPVNAISPIKSADLNRLAKRPACSILNSARLEPLRSHKLALNDYLRNF